ncbi:MAG: GNAT family N-acetyltransferase, partial [Granulosicoccaceae bacterium]
MSLDSIINELGLPIGLPVENWQAREAPPSTSMQGRFCTLVPTDVEAHGMALYEAFAKDTDHSNWTYLPYGPFATAAEFVAWLSQVSAGQDPLFHTVLNGDRVPVGLTTYLRVDPGPGVIEVGHIHFSPLMQRTPMATEAMYLMMKRVFDELAYRRYEWKCNALNAPSRAAAERLGFSFEGVFRQAAVVKGHNRDTAW